MPKPRILSPETTITMILDNNLSVSRFGDGEFRLMSKKGSIGFQSNSDLISNSLTKAFMVRSKKVLICTSNYNLKWPKNSVPYKWRKVFLFRYYKFFKRLYDMDYVYGDAGITRFYDPGLYSITDFSYLEKKYVPLLKKIWDKRNVIIVEGDMTKLGVGNNLFDNVRSIRRIICPSKNAYDKYKCIRKSIVDSYNQGDMVLIALGPTASILAVDLTTKNGIQCIDIGHIDIVYMWLINKVKNKCFVEGKAVNEASQESGVIENKVNLEKYQSEIISII